ncbi:MAG: TraR/DksA C4-type zinc finger protein [Thiovulaceae bacterium]|nr:TraR/DksA C4-type zinc finger protein [Sulfurimonadaceae bacterium]
MRSLESAHLRLSKLQYLLATIETNTDYGFCTECGDEIPFERLLLLLETRYCIHCAS